MSDIVVNDTNIFIDLCELHLLDELFKLPLEIHTVDFVIAELINEKQRKEVVAYYNKGKLIVHTFSYKDLQKVFELKNSAKGNVSMTDCAAWYYAKENDFILVTGDKQLRQRAIISNVTVKGLLFLFEKMVEENVIPQSYAADKLEELLRINQRSPRKEISYYIDLWRNGTGRGK